MQVLSAGGTFPVRELGQPLLCESESGPGFSFARDKTGAWQLTLEKSETRYFSNAASSSSSSNDERLNAVKNRDARQVASALAEMEWDDSTPSMYLIPSSPTFPGVDAIRLPSMLFQVGFFTPWNLVPVMSCAECFGDLCWHAVCIARCLCPTTHILLVHRR